MVEDRGLNLGRNAVRVRPLRAGEPVDQAVRAVGLEVPTDFIELLPGIADQRNRCLDLSITHIVVLSRYVCHGRYREDASIRAI